MKNEGTLRGIIEGNANVQKDHRKNNIRKRGITTQQTRTVTRQIGATRIERSIKSNVYERTPAKSEQEQVKDFKGHSCNL